MNRLIKQYVGVLKAGRRKPRINARSEGAICFVDSKRQQMLPGL